MLKISDVVVGKSYRLDFEPNVVWDHVLDGEENTRDRLRNYYNRPDSMNGEIFVVTEIVNSPEPYTKGFLVKYPNIITDAHPDFLVEDPSIPEGNINTVSLHQLNKNLGDWNA